MRPLVLCQTCKRHVKGSEEQCPFCGTAVLAASGQAAVRARGLPGGRAALFLAGSALVPACAVETVPDAPSEGADAGDAAVTRDSGPDANGMATPVYGVAIDSGLIPVPPYGIAIPPDAGAADSGATDAGCPQFGNLPLPVYGIPVDSGIRTNDCTDAGRDADKDAGKDSGLHALPAYGIAIDR